MFYVYYAYVSFIMFSIHVLAVLWPSCYYVFYCISTSRQLYDHVSSVSSCLKWRMTTLLLCFSVCHVSVQRTVRFAVWDLNEVWLSGWWTVLYTTTSGSSLTPRPSIQKGIYDHLILFRMCMYASLRGVCSE